LIKDNKLALSPKLRVELIEKSKIETLLGFSILKILLELPIVKELKEICQMMQESIGLLFEL